APDSPLSTAYCMDSKATSTPSAIATRSTVGVTTGYPGNNIDLISRLLRRQQRPQKRAFVFGGGQTVYRRRASRCDATRQWSVHDQRVVHHRIEFAEKLIDFFH